MVSDDNEFIDAGNGYDITLALRDVYSLGAGETTLYATRTFFNSGAPGSVPPQPIPEPSSVLGTLAFGAFGAGWMLKRRQKQKVTG